MPTFYKWRSINKFSDAFVYAQKHSVASFTYRGKMKLHGTNAGITFDNGVAHPQKRSSFITVCDDNAGFAKFVSNLEIKDNSTNMVIYGEWAGPGVQKSDAVTMISDKCFFVFSVLDLDNNTMIIDPTELEVIVSNTFGKDYESQRVYVLPWHTQPMSIDFSRQPTCQRFIDGVMAEVDERIAKEDEYIKQTFGVSGPGEGLVMYGIEGYLLDGTPLDANSLLSYCFKAKTEKHAVQKTKSRNHVAPERPEGIDDFIDSFYTEQRFEQVLNQIGGEATREKTGQFIKAVMTDVYKESEQEILLADFDWKDVPRYAASKVKSWWFTRCDEL